MIKIYEPHINNKLAKEYLCDVIDSGWLGHTGKYVELCTEYFEKLFGCYCLLTSNGTAATELLHEAVKFKYPEPKDIVTQDNVFVAVWNSAKRSNAYESMEILRVDEKTLNFSTENLKNSICPFQTTVLKVVHNIGNIVNVPQLKRDFPKLVIIEDNCEGLFGKYEGKFTGTEAFCSSVSFFANKTITSGEGGMFMTKDREVFDYIKSLHSHGQTSERYLHDKLATNCRITNMQASVLWSQIQTLPEILSKKSEIFNRYRNFCENSNGFYQIQESDPTTDNANWMFILKSPKSHVKLSEFLEKNGIETRRMFYPIASHLQFELSHRNSANTLDNWLMLPSHPGLLVAEQEYIFEKLEEFRRDNG
jgi:perosamine synthetase